MSAADYCLLTWALQNARSDGSVERGRRDKAEVARLGLMNARRGEREGSGHAEVTGETQQSAALHVVDRGCENKSQKEMDADEERK